ncbi:hypothetical protein DBR40_10870 [Pedobacter sp. KBW01]|uniref:FEKKY domain-containing protein n=1 Tax=Pedobacter sp. KBW01 TaxID=2153364 RepID=UPI000F5ADB7F|nr:hypothetical protein [Pedobacter sp. KBW01]RQO77152.1 hypothetical protein DBR40_10870 [Pedobacter sp. KBW01]
MKKHLLIWMILCLISGHLSAKAVLVADSVKVQSIKRANADIKKGKLKFLIQGGIAPTRVKGQEIFKHKYGLEYYDLGCVGPSDITINDYNKVIAAFMDRKFGKGWRKEVRKDVRGI